MTALFTGAALAVVFAVVVWALAVRLDTAIGRRGAVPVPRPPAAADDPPAARGSSALTPSTSAPLLNPDALVRLRADTDPDPLATCWGIWAATETRGGGHG
ncbi:MAG: hypothetical protein ACRDQ0_00735 [Pseudonocardia sp.]